MATCRVCDHQLRLSMTYLILATFFVSCLTTKRFVTGRPFCSTWNNFAAKAKCFATRVTGSCHPQRFSASELTLCRPERFFARRTSCLSCVRTTSISDPCLAQRRVIDHKAILHVALEQTFVGFIDLLNLDQLDVCRDSLIGAEVEHLLGFGDAADGGAR